MSYVIPKENLDNEWKNYIKKECNIQKKITKWNFNPESISIFQVEDEMVRLPLAMWFDMCEEFPNKGPFAKIIAKFEGELLEQYQRDQKTAMKEAVNLLHKYHAGLLAFRTGFGKTFCTLYLICTLKVKAIVLCHATTLHEQWVKEAARWCPDLKIQIVKGKKLDPDADVYMMGVIKSTHFDRSVFEGIGLVIIDECQMTLTSTFSKALLQFEPKYLVGLSATPDRNDGMHQLLYPYFGPKERFIVRTEKKSFRVIKYKTYFKPEVRYGFDGTIDWSTIISSTACNPDRQKFIVDLCMKYPKEDILILCDRVCEIVGCKNYAKCTCKPQRSPGLVPLLEAKKQSVDYRADTKKKHDEGCRIVIGTKGKLGVGYDSKRTLLIMDADTTDVRQNEGRIRTDNNLIIDIVDNHSTFENHWKKRAAWYKKRGAIIEEKMLDIP